MHRFYTLGLTEVAGEGGTDCPPQKKKKKNSEIKKNNLRFIFKIPRICTFLDILHTHCDLAWKGGRRMMAKIHEGSKFFKKW